MVPRRLLVLAAVAATPKILSYAVSYGLWLLVNRVMRSTRKVAPETPLCVH